MKNRRWLIRTGLILAFGLLAWVGYSTSVMTLDDRHDDIRAILEVDQRAAPGTVLPVRVAAIDVETGTPHPGRSVVIEVGDNGRKIAAGEADEKGVFSAEIEAPEQPGDVEVRARVDAGAVDQTPTARFSVERDHSIVLQTDKPRYQPGQDIQIRALVRQLGGKAVEDDVPHRRNPTHRGLLGRQLDV